MPTHNLPEVDPNLPEMKSKSPTSTPGAHHMYVIKLSSHSAGHYYIGAFEKRKSISLLFLGPEVGFFQMTGTLSEKTDTSGLCSSLNW